MANHSPDPNNYQISKTWDEAIEGRPASGEDELPQLAEAVKKTEAKGEASHNGGGDETERNARKSSKPTV